MMVKDMTISEKLKEAVTEQVSAEIDEMIAKEVVKFERMLTDRKDEYISKVMKGIRIAHEYDPALMTDNYRIIVENVVRIERQ